MNTLPLAQDCSWFFLIDAPGHPRNLLPVQIPNKDDSTLIMPLILVADKKTGSVRTFDSKLQYTCSEPLRVPLENNIPNFSSSVMQQTPSSNMALSFCFAENGNLWIGWSSGHIGIYKMHLDKTNNSSKKSKFKNINNIGSKNFNSNKIHWSVINFFYEHRSAVHMIVSGPGPWVFSAGNDYHILQWDSEKLQVIRDLTNICRSQDEFKSSPIKMMCVTMGFSSTTNFTNSRNHFIFFFSTEKRAFYSFSLGNPENTDKPLLKKNIPFQRISSSRPVVTCSVVLVSHNNNYNNNYNNNDAASVLCLGDEEGAITFIPLTVIYDTEDDTSVSVLSSSSSSNSSSYSNSNYNYNSDGAYLRAVAGAALTAESLQLRGGRLIALTQLSNNNYNNNNNINNNINNSSTAITSCLLAAATSCGGISLISIEIAPIIAGGHPTCCKLLSILPTESSVTCLTSLFHNSEYWEWSCGGGVRNNNNNNNFNNNNNKRGGPVAGALTCFANGTTAVLFHFYNTLIMQDSELLNLRMMRTTSSSQKVETHKLEIKNKDIKQQEQQLQTALKIVAHATAIAEEAEKTIEEQRREMYDLKSTKDKLNEQVQQLAEALNKKSEEVLTFKQQQITNTNSDINSNKLKELEQRNKILEEEINILRLEKKKDEEEKKRVKELEAERDRMESTLQNVESRYQVTLDELLRENSFLTESLRRLEREKQKWRHNNEINQKYSQLHSYPAQNDKVKPISTAKESSLRELLEQALGSLGPTNEEEERKELV